MHVLYAFYTLREQKHKEGEKIMWIKTIDENMVGGGYNNEW